jgi:hypothetical protein
VKPNHKSRGNKRQGKDPTGNNPEASLRTKGRGMPNQGEEGGTKNTKDKEASECTSRENIESPRNKGEQGGSAYPREGGNEDANTPRQEEDGDSKMTPSKVGTEDPDLKDIMEREGIDLPNILDQWKRQGVDNVPAEQLDCIQYLLLLREEAKSRGIKRIHGKIGHLGNKICNGQPQHSPKKARRKKGRK